MSEISGMITNGMERGWSAEEITKSLISAGYSQEEINLEFKNTNPIQQIAPSGTAEFNSQNLTNYQTPSILSSGNKKTIWIIVSLLIICGIVGAFLLF